MISLTTSTFFCGDRDCFRARATRYPWQWLIVESSLISACPPARLVLALEDGATHTVLEVDDRTCDGNIWPLTGCCRLCNAIPVMKQLALAFCSAAALACAIYAGPEQFSGKDKEVIQPAPPPCDWYRAHDGTHRSGALCFPAPIARWRGRLNYFFIFARNCSGPA